MNKGIRERIVNKNYNEVQFVPDPNVLSMGKNLYLTVIDCQIIYLKEKRLI